MTGRERIMNVIHGGDVDRVSLTTLLDDTTRLGFSDEYREVPAREFHRKLGYDIFSFGGMGFDQGPSYPYEVTHAHETVTTTDNDGLVTVERRLGDLCITNRYKNGRNLKFAVDTAEDLKALIAIYEAAQFVEFTGERLAACARSLRAFNEYIGEDGIYTATVGPSGVQTLIEWECGLENFYYLLADHRELVEQAIEAVQGLRRREYETLARHLAVEMIIPIENTSSRLTSPEVYKKYSQRHIREYTETAHHYGKKSVVHMCGHLRCLLDEIKATGIDGIHFLTPPSVGDCPLAHALDVLGENLFAVTLLSPEILHDPAATPTSITDYVRSLLTPRIKKARFLHSLPCDGLPTPIWKFEVVREAMEKYG